MWLEVYVTDKHGQWNAENLLCPTKEELTCAIEFWRQVGKVSIVSQSAFPALPSKDQILGEPPALLASRGSN